MNKKELKKLARKIAEAEKTIQTSDNHDDKVKAQDTIIRLSQSVVDFEDMMELDAMVQEILENS